MLMVKKTIGITGNIATGKSVLRRMLANSGALEIDADVIAHRMLYPDGPAYQPVLDAFGVQILSNQGEILHSKLGQIVFNDADKLSQLESLVHPWVTQSIISRLQGSQLPLTAIEAIKLLEAGLGGLCDSVWVSHVPKPNQIARLMQTRNMDQQAAAERIACQPPQSEKLAQADVIINTAGSYQQTWQQIQTALNDTIQINRKATRLKVNALENCHIVTPGSLAPDRLESFWRAHSGHTVATLYELLGSKILLPITKEGLLSPMVILDSWNFTANINTIVPAGYLQPFSAQIFQAIHTYCKMAQYELVFITDEIVQDNQLNPTTYGYDHQPSQELPYPGWQRARHRLLPGQSKSCWRKIISQPLERTLPPVQIEPYIHD